MTAVSCSFLQHNIADEQYPDGHGSPGDLMGSEPCISMEGATEVSKVYARDGASFESLVQLPT